MGPTVIMAMGPTVIMVIGAYCNYDLYGGLEAYCNYGHI